MIRPFALPLLLALAFGGAGPLSAQDDFPPPVNTQNPNDRPPTPEEAWAKMKVPEGFRVTLFAAEPDVRQPIAMHIDDRGRLWVAESYTYAADLPADQRWDAKYRDRVLIFEDGNHDGRFDKRTVFWDGAKNLSSVATGFGGVWVLCAPELLFLPDRDGDDVPDGPPEVVLDGFVVKGVGHNIVNGLAWGPDGWLYGRHGIQNTSLVGTPGTPPEQRRKLNCSIWRYHPTRKVFEVVCTGTTNPWGHDWDDHGQLFFTNNVNGHLFHVAPGAHFIRMYGEDFDPHLYELIDKHADHDHWDSAGKSWTTSRDNQGKNYELGGGHSHVGAMIYLGDNWPDRYRNTIFACNTHGRRVNNDLLERRGCGYVAKHGRDFLFADDAWFRGVTLLYGPDGGVYLSDWSDLGECHDHDGVHRTSGRVYKVTYGQARPPAVADVAKLSDAELVGLQLHKNDFYVRAARRLLQERAAAGRDMTSVHAALRQIYDTNPNVTRQLRALWALYGTGGTDEAWLRRQLGHASEHVRVWAIKLLVDQGPPSDAAVNDFVGLAQSDPSGLVRLFLASALQRLPVHARVELAAALLTHGEDANDHDQPLMLWYGVEPVVAAAPDTGVRLALESRIPKVRQFITRRLAEDLDERPAPLNTLLSAATQPNHTGLAADVLRGTVEALRGRRKATPPPAWAAVRPKLDASADPAVKTLARELGVVFGDGRALDELRRIVLDARADGAARRDALQVLLASRDPQLLPVLQKVANDRVLSVTVLRGLANFDDPAIAQQILGRFRYFNRDEKPAAVETLVSRPSYARALLAAVDRGQVDRADVGPFHARQIHSFNDPELNKELSRVWGEVRATPADKKQQVERYKQMLTAAAFKDANLSQGRVLFNQHCASCHKLFGEGKVVGPDLTGANRDSLDYLLENLIDPSGVLPADFRVTVVTLKDGRVLNGVVGNAAGRVLTVQTQTEQVKVDRDDVEDMQPTTVSLMPEGQLNNLSEAQTRDLIAYLMARGQVPLPGEKRSGE